MTALPRVDPIYEPAEDSELLASVVETHACGTALDVGTGSGYLAKVAYSVKCTVTAIDANALVIKRLRAEKVPFRVVLSDGFSNVRGTFDTIICNPPYLPNDDELFDPALHGGPKGYEYIVRIIADAAKHIAPNGQFLFLISTLTKPAVVEDALKRNGYVWTIVAREKLFMEELFVYRATLALDRPAVLLGEGWRSAVYGIDARTAVKITTAVRARKEAQILRAVNKQGIGPTVLRVDDGHLVMRRVTGTPFDETFARSSLALKKKLARALLAQLFKLDTLGIKKHELTRPGANVLVTTSGRVVLLDFERATYSKRPNNVPQFCAYLEKVLHAEVATVRAACAAYTRAPAAVTYRAVLTSLVL
jgi:release factor glutamine methyltransferase